MLTESTDDVQKKEQACSDEEINHIEIFVLD
jgi:hypothetical protein